MLIAKEGYRDYYDPKEDPSKVIFGRGCVSRLPEELSRLGDRALLITSLTLERTTDIVSRIRERLGEKLVGVFRESAAHTPRTVILRAAAFARPLRINVVISLGGGRHTDTAKALRLALWLGIEKESDFDEAYAAYKADWLALDPTTRARPLIPQIGLPTTLISAEHTQGVGLTDEVKQTKQVFSHPALQSSVIFLDPDLSTATPSELWFSTGIKALEHAIAKLSAPDRDPVVEAVAAQSVRILGSELLRCHDDPNDLGARGNLLIASWTCMFGGWRTLVKRMGLSHALGRQVGAVSGASHGLISGVLLPRCMEFNAPACGGAILLAAEALGLAARGSSPEEACLQAASEISGIVRSLGLPNRLRDIGVAKDDLARIAEKTMNDMSTATNPRKVEHAGVVLALLERAW